MTKEPLSPTLSSPFAQAHSGAPEEGKGVVIYLGLGTNLGDKEQNIQKACELLEDRVGHITQRSSLYYSKPWGFKSENDFVNAVVEIETELPPHELLIETQGVEQEMGRTEKSVEGEYHDRIIDIDILLYGDAEIDDPDLVIPHPLMKERDFVMAPLNEIIKNAENVENRLAHCGVR